MLVKFFTDIEQKCLDSADHLPLKDTVGRDRAYYILTLTRRFHKTLMYYAENQQFHQEQLDELLGASKKPLLGGIFGG